MAFKMKGFSGFKNVSKTKHGNKSAAYQKKGDPEKEMTQEEKDAAIANAMGAAEKTVIGDETRASAQEHFGGVNNMSYKNVQAKINEYESILSRTGLPEKSYQKYKDKLADARKTAKAVNPELSRNL